VSLVPAESGVIIVQYMWIISPIWSVVDCLRSDFKTNDSYKIAGAVALLCGVAAHRAAIALFLCYIVTRCCHTLDVGQVTSCTILSRLLLYFSFLSWLLVNISSCGNIWRYHVYSLSN